MFGSHWPDVAVLRCTFCHYLMPNVSSGWPTSCVSSQSLSDWLREGHACVSMETRERARVSRIKMQSQQISGETASVECQLSELYMLNVRTDGGVLSSLRACAGTHFGDSWSDLSSKMSITQSPFKHTNTHTHMEECPWISTLVTLFNLGVWCHPRSCDSNSHFSLWKPWQQVRQNVYFQPRSGGWAVTRHLDSKMVVFLY